MRNNKKLDSTISVGFQWLVSMICPKWEELNTRITQDMEVKMREEKKEKEARAERVRRSRELRSVEFYISIICSTILDHMNEYQIFKKIHRYFHTNDRTYHHTYDMTIQC